jgi:two-component system, cell cycle sensor histidine kinase and response regulator CckA
MSSEKLDALGVEAALLEALPFPIATLDAHGTIVATNRAWVAEGPFAGAGSSCAVLCDCILPDRTAAAELYRGISDVLQGTQPAFSRSYTEPGGDCRHLSVSPYSGEGSAALLAVTPAVPSAGFSGQQDRQAQKMEAVGRLVGGVAHDFANVLTMISGYSEILLSRVHEADPLRPELDEIRKAANRGARLTAQLLGFSRGQPPQARVLDLNAAIADMERMLRPVIGEYIELETRLHPAPGRIKADPGQIEQVIMNLVLNARDAMPSGGRIEIATGNREVGEEEARVRGVLPGNYVILTIGDTGQGMTAETQSHLFEPFFTTKEKGKGTGLGLSTVYNIVKQSQGCVWAVSAPGEGTTFTICLPLAQESAEHAPARPAPRPGAGSETILLVEDEDGVRRLLVHVLTKRGYKVLEASGGEEALRIFERHPGPIDLVLTDMVMPRMSGRELGERIQRINRGVKVVFMSGYTDDVLVRTGALSPGMAFLQKPLRPETLTAKIRETLDAPEPAFRNTVA